MYLQLDDNGNVTGYSDMEQTCEGWQNVEEVPEDFKENYRYYRFSEGVLTFVDALKTSIEDTELLETLRGQRQEECFTIVNRGQVWYNNLTETQRTELEAWYQAWLDVTETKVIPTTPSWLE